MHKPITQPVARSSLLSDNELSRLTQRRPVAPAMLSSTSLARSLSSQSSSPLAHLTAALALALVPTLFGNRSARTYSPQRDERATDGRADGDVSHNHHYILLFSLLASVLPPFPCALRSSVAMNLSNLAFSTNGRPI